MSSVLRIIRRTKWYRPDWIHNNEVPADPLTDFKTENNTLSVWLLIDEQSDLDRIISALACNRDDISNFDYLIFDSNIINKYKINKKQTTGTSIDEELNYSSHFNLIELTTDQICSLTKEAFLNGKNDRIPKKKVYKMILNSINNGIIDKESLPEKIRNKLSL